MQDATTQAAAIDWESLQQSLPKRFRSAELLALSGRVHDQASFDRGLARLSVALPVHGPDCVSAPFQRFAAQDVQRQQWLDGVCHSGEASLLLGVRGGYGITRLLASAPLADIARRMVQTQSLLCGHSDFTALHLALLAVCLRENIIVPAMLQGPMLCIDWGADPAVERTFSDFMRVLKTDGTAAEVCVADGLRRLAPQALPDATLEGLLWGGNLSMICALLGTQYMPHVSGGLLFIEDVNEHPYRVERMLLQLHQAGILGRQKALLVGECSDWKPSPLDHGYGLADALQHISDVSGVPVFTGLRFGHIADKTCLPVGQNARLLFDATGQGSLNTATV